MKDIHDVITHAKFGDHFLRGSGVVAGQISAFPIDFAGRPYNTLTLPCERVIHFVLSLNELLGHAENARPENAGLAYMQDQMSLPENAGPEMKDHDYCAALHGPSVLCWSPTLILCFSVWAISIHFITGVTEEINRSKLRT